METRRIKPARTAFTLIELLVVIGIIGVLVSLLLPALNKARQQSYTIVCASHLRSIGQGIVQYADDYRGVFPPSNFYKGLGWDPVSGQIPATPVNGYVHWSSFLFNRHDQTNQDQNTGAVTAGQTNTDLLYKTLKGWEMFTCPALLNGGLAPANTFSANSDGLANEDGLTDSQIGAPPSLIDYQAPRMAYTLNEILCPRGIFQSFFSNRNNPRFYKFVATSRVRYPSSVILATELWGEQPMETTTSLIDGQSTVSNSRRPVNGISVLRTGHNVTPDAPYLLLYQYVFAWANLSDLTSDPESTLTAGGSVSSTLDYVGRNHGTKHLGPANGDGKNRGNWDQRFSNFLYVDGHVESKSITETIYPNNEWGSDFYTLDK